MSSIDLSILDDTTLAERSAKGDRAALETLLERHTQKAFSYAHAILGNREDALDAAQTALMRIAQELISGGLRQPFGACLYTRTHNAALNLLRQNANRRRREQSVVVQFSTKEAGMDSDRIEREETLQVLREELASLPEETAAVLACYHLEGLPIASMVQRRKIA